MSAIPATQAAATPGISVALPCIKFLSECQASPIQKLRTKVEMKSVARVENRWWP